jgi:hypothetical protein
MALLPLGCSSNRDVGCFSPLLLKRWGGGGLFNVVGGRSPLPTGQALEPLPYSSGKGSGPASCCRSREGGVKGNNKRYYLIKRGTAREK